MCETYCSRLHQLEPASRPVLEVLDRRNALHSHSGETKQSTAELLLRILVTRRFEGFDGRHVYWGTLERLYQPTSNTQRIAVPFTGGAVTSATCVSGARIFKLLVGRPAEYVRMIERLTSVENGFFIRRRYTPEEFEAKRSWLSGAFPFMQIGTFDLWIWIWADSAAPARALAEQEGRQSQEYDFGARDVKNTRLLGDVMLQSALTNYALRGQYDSAADCDRITAAQGIPFNSVGYQALDRDVFSMPHELDLHPEVLSEHHLDQPIQMELG
ncbi:hypothetical protein [Streptomyces luteogriseus]|uniref:hypothetical protein n=1 Tax=Streptomyces luteogriseus TaxID=68233 RepID=UPI0037885075